jgi:hypothetical protein
MALTTAEIVRLRLNDPWRREYEVQFGDGTASSFKLFQGAPYSNTISGTASVINTGWSATGNTWDVSAGYVEFSGVISAGTGVRFDYQWAVFSDADMAYFTAQGGITNAVLAGVQTLMGNAWKRARWQSPDGHQHDDSKAMDHLKTWRSALRAELVDDIGPEGGFESWGIGQSEY